jgi:hypothetical protein
LTQIDLSGHREVAAPQAGQTADAARRSEGIAVLSPKRVPGPADSRMTIEAPIAASPPATTITLGTEAVKEKANVEKGGRVFGRSVTQKTRAAEDGVAVPEAAGSSPTQSTDDVQKILQDIDKESAEG